VYDDDLTNLDDWIRRLKIEYHIFFSGNRKKPPDDLRLRVEKLVKKLSECSDMTYSQRFRYSTLITRYYVYRDLWRRKERDTEMGTDRKGEGVPTTDTATQSSGQSREAIRISLSDPKTEEDKVRTLYDTLIRLKKADSKEAHLSYKQFAKYIASQTHGIREKYGCSKVAFTIALEEDAIRFTAAADTR
jgi:hypothetical protein